MQNLSADDYEYKYPDHWILHDKDRGGLFERLNAFYVSRAIEIIKQGGAKTVLEVGCGDGWNCGEMIRAGMEVVGIDWSVNGIRYASMFVPKAQFFTADVRDQEFLSRFPEKFDAIALIEVLEHIPPDDCVSAMRSIAEPLKPGGIFVLTTPSTNHPKDNPQHYQHFTADKIRQIAKDAGGLEIVSIEGYGDAKAEKAHYRRTRWVNNRYYCFKPALRMLESYYHKTTRLRDTAHDRCHGFIVAMRKL